MVGSVFPLFYAPADPMLLCGVAVTVLRKSPFQGATIPTLCPLKRAKWALLMSDKAHIVLQYGLFRNPKWVLSQSGIEAVVLRCCVNR